jgi:hypothetical protein
MPLLEGDELRAPGLDGDYFVAVCPFSDLNVIT